MNTIKSKTKLNLKTVLVLIILFCTLFSYQSVLAASISPDTLGDFLNESRTQNDLNSLEYNSQLYEAAQNKATHMIENNYFEHYAPDGTSPWDFINESGYSYQVAGENLAMDFETSQAVHNAWMNSPTHKENILNPKFTEYAIASKQGKIDGVETVVIVQMFGHQINPVVEKTNNFVNSIINFLLGVDDLK